MLPKTPGPKLGRFKNGKHAAVQFVKGLGSGAHSHVWKVKIDGRTYALKMFRHIRADEESAASAKKLEKFGIDLQLLDDQLTPFNCEARAYGRLKETGSEHVAWGCYGYIALDEETYASVVWDTIGLPRREWFSQYITTDAAVADRPVFPIYALVKEFITDASQLGALDISRAHDMAQGINKLHSIGITHRDIRDRNYVDSRIMDFSTSWTVPNIRLDRELKWDPKPLIDEADTGDYFMFDNMIEKWNREHPDLPRSSYRMTQGEKYRAKAKAGARGGRASRRESSSSSGSSEELEEIPILERMRDNRYLVLASSYDWRGKRPAVARPDILTAPSSPVRDGGGGDQGPEEPPARTGSSTTPPRWPPLAFYVPDFPILGVSLPGMPTTPDSSSTVSPTTPVPDRAGPSTERNVHFTPGVGLGISPPASKGPRGTVEASKLEASKLEAIREAASGISSTCDTLKGMAESIIGIIDGDHSSSGPGGNDDNDSGNYSDGEVSPGTRRPQQQQQQHQQRAARPLGLAARTIGTARRRPRPDGEEGGGDEKPPKRRLRPRRNVVRYVG